MDAKRLYLAPVLAITMGAAAVLGMQAQSASAEVPLPQVSPYLRAAIEADIEARGYKYAGDIRFDSMYAAPGDWVSSVQSIGPSEAVVTYGKFASDEIITVKFVPKGTYGWVNPASGVGSPQRVPALAAQPGTTPNSWVIEGIDFPANQDVTFFDGSNCGGEQRCPTDHTVATVKAGADGYFKVTIQLDDSVKPVPGQVHRLLQASNGSFIQVALDNGVQQPAPNQPAPTNPSPTNPAPTNPSPTNPAPTNPVPTQPAPANPTPETPDAEDDDDGDNNMAYAAIAGLGLLAVAGGFGIVTATRRR